MKEKILESSIRIFGKYGFKKTTMMDLARAADLSKQGIYLHFTSKEELFIAATTHYLNTGLELVDRALAETELTLEQRILNAMNAWFGRHYDTYLNGTWDVISTANSISQHDVESYKNDFQKKLTSALQASLPKSALGKCTAREIAQTLFICGLAWKEQHESKEAFLNQISTCIKVCCRGSGEKV
ncbi:TetR/AcrR family transcriptional regulator [Microbulbifer hainanensis]|uniref:TetR/AcrR family transcriptional regulator n=1 Tax=Microbulbifer hainanensis TaxID=2735675 RepID=UPI0018690024|nr:TetR/AcrR family transcriptional regulator [Microbulbifer hainanensis]